VTTHTVIPQRPEHPDHAAPATTQRPVDAAAVAQYASTILPGVLYLLGTYAFDSGTVPAPLQGLVAVAVTTLCTLVVRWARRV
jgi:hypothetical protein